MNGWTAGCETDEDIIRASIPPAAELRRRPPARDDRDSAYPHRMASNSSSFRAFVVYFPRRARILGRAARRHVARAGVGCDRGAAADLPRVDAPRCVGARRTRGERSRARGRRARAIVHLLRVRRRVRVVAADVRRALAPRARPPRRSRRLRSHAAPRRARIPSPSRARPSRARRAPLIRPRRHARPRGGTRHRHPPRRRRPRRRRPARLRPGRRRGRGGGGGG